MTFYPRFPVRRGASGRLRLLPMILAAALGALPLRAAQATTVSDSSPLQAQAAALFEAGQDGQALSLLEDAQRARPNSLELCNYYRAEIRKRGLEERAITFLKELAAPEDASPEAQFNLAFAYIDKIPRVGPMGAGFLSKRSIATFKKVLDRQPDNWIANYGIGMNYLHWPEYFKKNDSAQGYLEKCLELQASGAVKPFYLLAYLRLGDAHARNGNPDLALDVWRQGLLLYPAHPDLLARLDLARDKISQAVNEYYNPNQSMAAIDTDVSVLWAKSVPLSAIPIKRAATRLGAGGQLASAGGNTSASDIGLFSWFTRNLPFLADKRHRASVDMSILGVKPSAPQARLASEIAHGMILGFLSVIDDDPPAKIAARTAELDSFTRPFYQEGLGMGLAASLDASDVGAMRQFRDEIARLDPQYARFHYVGAGLWFGLESSRSLDVVAAAFDALGAFGATYAYEGFGFAQVLFHYKKDPERLQLGARLPSLAAQTFFHGAGRAFWILGGDDLAAFKERLELVPAPYRADSFSGYGLGVAMTRGSDPAFVARWFGGAGWADEEREQFATGLTMGYVIRDIADHAFVAGIPAQAGAGAACWLPELLRNGFEALAEVEANGGDFHSNWRARIRERVRAPGSVIRTHLSCS